jgi:hypothetical protein
MIAFATNPLKIVGFADPSHRFAAGPSRTGRNSFSPLLSPQGGICPIGAAEGGYGFLKDMLLQLF